jgi:hypothetical protein
MARKRERTPLEHGDRLDLNSLLRQCETPSGPFPCTFLLSPPGPPSYPGETGVLALIFASPSCGLMWLREGVREQTIGLVALPCGFSGGKWFFTCPKTGRRAFVLWKPPGASCFASRAAFGKEFAYASQFEAPHKRAWRRADKIRFKLCGGDYTQMHSVFPPIKPKGMRWLTYVARLKLLEHFEEIGRSHFIRVAARLIEAG